MAQSLKERGRKWRRSFGKSLETPRDRFLSRLHFDWIDHAILRHWWTNLEEIAPGVWRSNQPGPKRLKRYKDMGITTVLSLRGTPKTSHYLFEREACEKLGLKLVTTELHARKPASRENLLRLFRLFREIERPFVMHCKSGADRAGLASALYMMAIEGVSVVEARKQLSLRYLHIKQSRTGVLDYMLDVYEARLSQGPIGIEEWIATEYDPAEIAAGFAALKG